MQILIALVLVEFTNSFDILFELIAKNGKKFFFISVPAFVHVPFA